eukprot:6175074-Pleurochrysis_carterae.AAC.5
MGPLRATSAASICQDASCYLSVAMLLISNFLASHAARFFVSSSRIMIDVCFRLNLSGQNILSHRPFQGSELAHGVDHSTPHDGGRAPSTFDI